MPAMWGGELAIFGCGDQELADDIVVGMVVLVI